MFAFFEWVPFFVFGGWYPGDHCPTPNLLTQERRRQIEDATRGDRTATGGNFQDFKGDTVNIGGSYMDVSENSGFSIINHPF